MEEGVDYTFIHPRDVEAPVHIEILTGKFVGTVFRYGQVKVSETDESHLQFAYYVIKSPVMKPKKLEKNKEFGDYTGDLLLHLIKVNLDLEEKLEGDLTDDEPREDNFKDTDL